MLPKSRLITIITRLVVIQETGTGDSSGTPGFTLGVPEESTVPVSCMPTSRVIIVINQG
jgi:hypothetical protein